MIRYCLLCSIAGLLLAMAPALAAAARGLSTDDIRIEGMTITFLRDKVTVTIDPLETVEREASIKLPAGEPSWRTAPRLPGVAWVCQGLNAESLAVTLHEDPDVALVQGRDYKLNAIWGALTGIEGSQSPPGTVVRCKYTYTKSRLDLVERTAEGELVVRKGTPDMTEPLLPEPSPGATPLAGIYLGPNTTELSARNVNLIDPDYDGVPPVVNGDRLRDVRQRLQLGKPTTIVFLGDSITAQKASDMRDGKGSFVDRFATWVGETRPEATVTVTPRDKPVEPEGDQVVIVKAGVGGNNSRQGLARVETDVLPHKPHAVVIMFGVNDENVPAKGGTPEVAPQAYAENLAAVVEKVRAAGAEAVIMTPSMKMLAWEHTGGNLHEYAEVARRVAAAKKACLIDQYQAWEDLPRRGYNYAVFLGTCINHPVDLGHDLFFRGVREAFDWR